MHQAYVMLVPVRLLPDSLLQVLLMSQQFPGGLPQGICMQPGLLGRIQRDLHLHLAGHY